MQLDSRLFWILLSLSSKLISRSLLYSWWGLCLPSSAERCCVHTYYCFRIDLAVPPRPPQIISLCFVQKPSLNPCCARVSQESWLYHCCEGQVERLAGLISYFWLKCKSIQIVIWSPWGAISIPDYSVHFFLSLQNLSLDHCWWGLCLAKACVSHTAGVSPITSTLAT